MLSMKFMTVCAHLLSCPIALKKTWPACMMNSLDLPQECSGDTDQMFTTFSILCIDSGLFCYDACFWDVAAFIATRNMRPTAGVCLFPKH